MVNPNIFLECCQTPVPKIETYEPLENYWVEMARYIWAYVVNP
jgi:hypothetical protein